MPKTNEKIASSRVSWVDNTRLLALIMVISYHWAFSVPYISQGHSAVLTHIKELLSLVVLQGYQGVGLFFFISAFGITLNFDKYKSVKDFYIKRAKTIYPSYFIVVAIAAMLSCLTIFKVFDVSSGPLFWIRNLSLIGFANNFQNGTWVGYFNPAWWFLFGIIQFYIIFPLLYSAIKKLKIIINMIVLALLCICCIFVDQNYVPIVIMFLPIFYAGIMLGIYHKRGLVRFKNNYLVAAMGIAFWIAGLALLHIENGSGTSRIIAPIGLFIFAICGLNFKSPKIVNKINSYSYEAYLVHNIIILFFPAVFIGFGISPVAFRLWVIGYIIYIILTYLIAHNVHQLSNLAMVYIGENIRRIEKRASNLSGCISHP